MQVMADLFHQSILNYSLITVAPGAAFWAFSESINLCYNQKRTTLLPIPFPLFWDKTNQNHIGSTFRKKKRIHPLQQAAQQVSPSHETRASSQSSAVWEHIQDSGGEMPFYSAQTVHALTAFMCSDSQRAALVMMALMVSL